MPFPVLFMKTYIIPLHKADLGDEGIHLLLSISINGQTEWAVLDTGASRSAFDETILGDIIGHTRFEDTDKLSAGLGTDSLKCRFTTIHELKIGQLVTADYYAAALDLSHINTVYQQYTDYKITGIIGNDLLLKYCAIINFEKLIVTLSEK